MKKNDIVAVLILSEIIALFLFFILKSLQIALLPAGSLFVVLPILAIIGIYIAYLIGKKILVIFQLAKFAIVGIANTAVDFGILNLLMFLTKTYEGKTIILFNTISFLIAVMHSYFWNKFWTFKANNKTSNATQFLQFLVVSIIGVFINSGIVYALSSLINPMFNLNQNAWVNMVKIVATIISLVWNFVGYKLIVFKEKMPAQGGSASG